MNSYNVVPRFGAATNATPPNANDAAIVRTKSSRASSKNRQSAASTTS